MHQESPEKQRRVQTNANFSKFFTWSRTIAIASCAYFLFWGILLIRYPGIQNDEALFGEVLYPPVSGAGFVSVFGTSIPVMVMTYLGCLKSWIYAAIFQVWPPSVMSIRVPVLIGGVITIWLFWTFARRAVGKRVATVSVILLATDTSFLLTTCFDWGPVVLQHLLVISGVLALIRFQETRSEKMLALGFFLFGLGLWDKALFLWTLAGITVAAIIVFPREVWKQTSLRRLGIAGVCLLIGAFPLLCYNVQHSGVTLSGNAKFSLQDFRQKADALRQASEGSAFFGYMVPATDVKQVRKAQSAVERTSVILSRATGKPNRNFAMYAFLLALLLLPFMWKSPARKPMLFSLVLMVVVWVQMVSTKGAGTGAHHVVLMWPWPMLFVGAGLVEASSQFRRVGTHVLVATVLLLLAVNCALTNQYLAEMIEDGPATVWTDAIFPLANYLYDRASADIYSVDWGTTNSLRLLDRGTLRIQEATFAILKNNPDELDRNFLARMIRDHDALLIAHTPAFESFQGINARLNALAAGFGYQQQLIATIYDYEGRPVFQLFRYQESNRLKE